MHFKYLSGCKRHDCPWTINVGHMHHQWYKLSFIHLYHITIQQITAEYSNVKLLYSAVIGWNVMKCLCTSDNCCTCFYCSEHFGETHTLVKIPSQKLVILHSALLRVSIKSVAMEYKTWWADSGVKSWHDIHTDPSQTYLYKSIPSPRINHPHLK